MVGRWALDARHALSSSLKMAIGCIAAAMLPADALAQTESQVPGWVIYPDKEWTKITPEQAGLDVEKFEKMLASSDVHAGGWGGVA